MRPRRSYLGYYRWMFSRANTRMTPERAAIVGRHLLVLLATSDRPMRANCGAFETITGGWFAGLRGDRLVNLLERSADATSDAAVFAVLRQAAQAPDNSGKASLAAAPSLRRRVKRKFDLALARILR